MLGTFCHWRSRETYLLKNVEQYRGKEKWSKRSTRKHIEIPLHRISSMFLVLREKISCVCVCVSALAKWWVMSTCHSLGRSPLQPPVLWGTHLAGRGGCSGESSCFWDPHWMLWSLLPPGTETRIHSHNTSGHWQAVKCTVNFEENLLWTEFGSLPWCNPGRNTFWWSVRKIWF